MEPVTRKYVEGVVIDTLKEVPGLPVEEVSLDASYEGDMGLDSIDTVEIAVELENHFRDYGFPGFDDDDVASLRTPRKTVDYIMENVRKA